jgi:mercuric ion transport protein
MKVELIYDTDCPNVAETRANLLQAFAAAHLEAEWTEWERSSPSIPAYAVGFGSPTVLVDGGDVAGENPREHISCCRLYASIEGQYSGAPSVELLKTSFAPATLAAAPSHWQRSFLAVPGIVLSVLPVGMCPACWPLYAGVLSALGLSFLLSSAYLLPLTALCLLVSVFTLAFRARARRGYGPFALGLVATTLILWGKFSVESNVLAYAGVGLLISSSVWNSWPRRAADRCPQCAPASGGLVQLSAKEMRSL